MQRKLCLTLLLVLLGAMAYLPRGRAQRSGYAPLPVNTPGLLPRFAGVDDDSAPSGSSSQQAPSFSSGGGDSVGNRLGEDIPFRDTDRTSRPAVNQGRVGQGRCPAQQVPCYDCVVYISRSGQITRFSAEQGGGRW